MTLFLVSYGNILMDNGPSRLVYTPGAEKMNGSGTLTSICVLACVHTSVYLYMLYFLHFSIRSFVEKSFLTRK